MVKTIQEIKQKKYERYKQEVEQLNQVLVGNDNLDEQLKYDENRIANGLKPLVDPFEALMHIGSKWETRKKCMTYINEKYGYSGAELHIDENI